MVVEGDEGWEMGDGRQTNTTHSMSRWPTLELWLGDGRAWECVRACVRAWAGGAMSVYSAEQSRAVREAAGGTRAGKNVRGRERERDGANIRSALSAGTDSVAWEFQAAVPISP